MAAGAGGVTAVSSLAKQTEGYCSRRAALLVRTHMLSRMQCTTQTFCAVARRRFQLLGAERSHAPSSACVFVCMCARVCMRMCTRVCSSRGMAGARARVCTCCLMYREGGQSWAPHAMPSPRGLSWLSAVNMACISTGINLQPLLCLLMMCGKHHTQAYAINAWAAACASQVHGMAGSSTTYEL